MRLRSFLAAFLALLLFAAPASAYTREEVRARYGAISDWARGDLFAVSPSTAAPYAVGEVRAEALEDALGYLNFLRWLAGLGGTPPERVAEAAEEAYYRRVIHGAPTLRTVYAFLTLKENEAAMLKRAFVALGYGLSPEKYILQ